MTTPITTTTQSNSTPLVVSHFERTQTLLRKLEAARQAGQVNYRYAWIDYGMHFAMITVFGADPNSQGQIQRICDGGADFYEVAEDLSLDEGPSLAITSNIIFKLQKLLQQAAQANFSLGLVAMLPGFWALAYPPHSEKDPELEVVDALTGVCLPMTPTQTLLLIGFIDEASPHARAHFAAELAKKLGTPIQAHVFRSGHPVEVNPQDDANQIMQRCPYPEPLPPPALPEIMASLAAAYRAAADALDTWTPGMPLPAEMYIEDSGNSQCEAYVHHNPPDGNLKATYRYRAPVVVSNRG